MLGGGKDVYSKLKNGLRRNIKKRTCIDLIKKSL
jgi:hypothetical protein